MSSSYVVNRFIEKLARFLHFAKSHTGYMLWLKLVAGKGFEPLASSL